MAKKANAIIPLDYLKKIQYDGDQETSWYRNSKAAIRSFLNTVFDVSQTPTTGLKAPEIRAKQEEDDRMYEELAIRYFKEKRDYKEDLFTWRKKSGKSARTMQMYLSPVKIFLEKNGHPLTTDDTKELYKTFRKGKEAPRDAVEKHEIRSFLQHCDVRMKAITYLLIATGCRIGEILALTDDMIDKKRKMITLPPDVTKTDAGRVIFYNYEAAEALQQWIQERGDYIARNNVMVKNISGAKEVSVTDPRIFPYDVEPINRAWNKTCKRAGMDKKNRFGFMNFHPHGMRKFFSVQMRIAGCPDGICECLLGHTVNLSMYQDYTPR
jgi:integrase